MFNFDDSYKSTNNSELLHTSITLHFQKQRHIFVTRSEIFTRQQTSQSTYTFSKLTFTQYQYVNLSISSIRYHLMRSLPHLFTKLRRHTYSSFPTSLYISFELGDEYHVCVR